MNTSFTYKTVLKKALSFFGLIFVLLLISSSLHAQRENENNLYSLDAVLLTSDSLQPVPDAHIISKRMLWGNISNDEGRFKMLVDPYDTLMITSIGYVSKIFFLTDSVRNLPSPDTILMEKDTVLINEVVIHAYWDYETFKQMIIEMPSMDISQFYPDMTQDPLMYVQPGPYTIGGPVQALYNIFNRSARLQRKLIKNRREYNNIMIEMGRPQDTIPAIPEHMRAMPH